MGHDERVRAWRPDVPGVNEVLHAHFTHHAYPAHTHGDWTLLLVDTGGVDYALDRARHQAPPRSLTVLPPHVPHDGRAALPGGFDKRVLYVDERWLPARLAGAAADAPHVADAQLARAVRALHGSLGRRDDLESESRLAFVAERVVAHLDRRAVRERRDVDRADHATARHVRDRLDADDRTTLVALAAELGTHPTRLVRAFGRAYGMPPHRYVVGRRVDRARRMLLAGVPTAEAAVLAGFHDQPHLTRHFRRLLGVTPGRFRAA
ncbi:helix-turn-helix transcriptional regulator [Cellulomonas massiliensis]|uniref:helix-turn-helix transcriptional regulator n=1 Tax=Cellulomonas massiliensis TaxID=1465811 RepID=UPI0003820AFD|nr:AraC family transcriptional regulator [Cellulomonas massiliensis]